MTDQLLALLHRLLDALEKLLPDWALAGLLSALALLTATAALYRARRRAAVTIDPPDPYAPYRSPTINVSVASAAVSVDARPLPGKLAIDPSRNARLIELSRIASIPADEDEDFWTS